MQNQAIVVSLYVHSVITLPKSSLRSPQLANSTWQYNSMEVADSIVAHSTPCLVRSISTNNLGVTASIPCNF